MAVAFDANATAVTSAGGVTTLDNGNLTVGSGANRALVAQFNTSGAITSVTAVWDPGGANQALTQIVVGTDGNGNKAYLFGLVAPVSGNKILRFSWTTARSVALNCLSFTGADQTGGATTFAHTNAATGYGTAAQVIVTSATGDAAVDCLSSSGASAPTSPTKTQTYAGGTGAPCYGGSRASGAATVTFGWTIPFADQWVETGCDIVAAAPVATVAQYENAIQSALASGGIVGVNHWGT